MPKLLDCDSITVPAGAFRRGIGGHYHYIVAGDTLERLAQKQAQDRNQTAFDRAPTMQEALTIYAEAQRGEVPTTQGALVGPAIQPARSLMQQFPSGAIRSSDAGKNDYEGFINPLVLEVYGDYMTHHRIQADGKVRDSDNWQKGMTLAAYLKSLLRHVVDLWKLHRGYKAVDKTDGHLVDVQEACCAILFNAFGYLNETIKGHRSDLIIPGTVR